MRTRTYLPFLLYTFVVLSLLTAANWIPTGNMNVPRSAHTATLLPNGKVLVAGGDDGGFFNITATAELYDPTTQQWTTTGSMNVARSYHTATLLEDGTVLVAGGLVLDENQIAVSTDTVELYDPATGLWRMVGTLNQARSEHRAVLLADGQVVVVGGYDAAQSTERYDPTSQQWTVAADLNTPRFRHTATLLDNGFVLAAGGDDGDGATAVAELYNPTMDTWTTTASMNSPRSEHTATLLQDGSVLVVAGGNLVHLNTAERYDPVQGTWSNTGTLTHGRYGHTATRLADGNVLITSGYIDNEEATDRAELYDVTEQRWSNAGTIGRNRNLPTATLLNNGAVLLAGGREGSAVTDTFLYQPNDRPVAEDDTALTITDQAVAIDVLANDQDEVGTLSPATVVISGGPAHGSVAVITTTGVISYTPALAFSGIDTFQYSVQDTLGTISNRATVTVTVNDLPVAIPDRVMGQIRATVMVTVTTNDTDTIGGIDPTTVEIVRQPQHGTASYDTASTQMRYTPNTGFVGQDTLQYTVQDGLGATSNAVTVTFQIGEFLYLPLIQQQADADSALYMLTENGNFTIFVEGLTASGVVNELAAAAPVTLFVPTDAAFTALMAQFSLTKEQLFRLPEFPDILRYHMLATAMQVDEFADGMELETMQGSQLQINVVEDAVLLNNTAEIIAMDVIAADGIIHIIDTVLLPPVD